MMSKETAPEDSYDCRKQSQVFCIIPMVSVKFGGAVVHVRRTT